MGSKDESNKHIGKYIADAAKVSVASHGRFSLALSGGSQPEQVKAGLDALTDGEKAELQVDKWIVLFADERSVPNDHEDSNYLNSKSALEAIGIKDSQVIKIDTSAGDVAAQAQDYEKRLLSALVSLQCHQNWISSCSEWARTDTLLLCSPGMRCSKNLLLWWRRSATRPSPPRHASL